MADPYREAVRNQWPPDRLLEQLEELADAEFTRSYDVPCKGCKNTYSYRLPAADARTRLAALSLISDLGYGKAAPAKTEDQKPLPTDVDPATMNSQDRQSLITQIRTRLEADENSGISPAVPPTHGARAED